MLAVAGVSEVHVIVVGIVTLPGPRSVANSWSSKPTGNAGSLALRPEKLKLLPPGVGASALHAPKLERPEAQMPVEPRCSDRPAPAFVCDTPMSMGVVPAAGPLVAGNVPSYDRNSSTWPSEFTSAIPSGPFWMPSTG